MSQNDATKWTNPQTHDAWIYLTDEKRQDYTQQYVEEALSAVLAGRIKLVKRTEIAEGQDGVQTEEVTGKQITPSLTARSVLVTRLVSSFGEDAPDGVYDLDTWAGHMAFSAAMAVDWEQIADQLLRRFTLEYVPSEVE